MSGILDIMSGLEQSRAVTDVPLYRRSVLLGTGAVLLGAATGCGEDELPQRVKLGWSMISPKEYTAEHLDWQFMPGDLTANSAEDQFSQAVLVAAPADNFPSLSNWQHVPGAEDWGRTNYVLFVKREDERLQFAQFFKEDELGEFDDQGGQQGRRLRGIAVPLGEIGMDVSLAYQAPDESGASAQQDERIEGVSALVVPISPWPEYAAAVKLADYPPKPL